VTVTLDLSLDVVASVRACSRQNAEGAVKIWEDLDRYRAVIKASSPQVVVECGTWRGGSAAWFAHQGLQVVTIDTIPYDGWRDPRVTYLTGQTQDPVIAALAAGFAAGNRAMAVLDSDHSQAQVAAEISLYGPLVHPGCYLVVEDGICRWLPEFDQCGSPLDAIEDLLAGSPEWVRDTGTEGMYPVTMHPAGWWRRA
jgi:cephalosporin hydroxylase